MIPEEITEQDETSDSEYEATASAEESTSESSYDTAPARSTPHHTRTPSQKSLLTMPIHDGMREFFFLQAFCVKIKLSRLFGVTPDLTPPTNVLWKKAHSQKVMFHDYYDFLVEQLGDVYGYWQGDDGRMPQHGRVTIPGGPHPIHDTDLDFVYTTPDRPPSPDRYGYAGFEEMEALDLGMDPIMPASIPTNPLPLYERVENTKRKKQKKSSKKRRSKKKKKRKR